MNALEIVDACGPAVLQALTVIAPVISAVAPALGVATDHPILTGVAFLAGGGTAANLTARVLNRVPLGPVFLAMEKSAAIVTRAGNASAVRVIYEPFEAFAVKFIIGGAQAVARGLTSDNASCATITSQGVPPPQAPQ
jgi:hypothetical protein